MRRLDVEQTSTAATGSRIIQNTLPTSAHIIVDMADMKAASHSGMISTSSLGGCVAVAIYDNVAKVGGLLHYILPTANLRPERALNNPYLFADTGIPMLFRRAYKLGAVKERIVCKLAGASNVFDPKKSFNFGRTNYEIALEVLTRNNVPIAAKYTGGHNGMKVTLHLGDGRVLITLPNREEFEI